MLFQGMMELFRRITSINTENKQLKKNITEDNAELRKKLLLIFNSEKHLKKKKNFL